MFKKENLPNLLTLARIVLIPIFLLMTSLASSNVMHIAAAVVFAIASITDYLDGYLARKWHVVTNFGKFADPLADKMLVMSAFIMLVGIDQAPAWVVSVIICRELAVTGLRLLLVENGGTVLAAAMPGKIKTVTQMLSIILLLCHLHFVGTIMLYIALFFTIYSGYDYFKGAGFLFKDTFKLYDKSMIEIKKLKFKYNQDQTSYTLNDVSFHVKRGEWLSIVGHNGSGKSTTARLIDGLLVAESGQIIVDGQELTEDNVWDIRDKIGMVFQNPDNQFVGATVEDDVAFGLENKGVPYEEMASRVQEALEFVGMSEFKDREPSRLSGGQKQRVAIAGIVAMRPSILILDEATSMLDPEGRQELIQSIKAIRKEYGMTVLSITHDLDEVALSDRVLVLKKGKVESVSSPRELFSRGSELVDLGLDIPFSALLTKKLRNKGLIDCEDYLTEKELVERLWESLSKM